MYWKINCSAWRIKQAVKFIDKTQHAAILKLSPLLHGLSEDISCQKKSGSADDSFSRNCVYIVTDITYFPYSDRPFFVLLIVLQLLSLLSKGGFPKQLHCIHVAL